MMSIPTALIGMLPTHWGYLATFGLVILRLVQGFAAGGETPVSVCYVFETAPLHMRSFLCGIVSVSSSIGFLVGSATVSAMFWYFSQEAIIAWAWRIPFLLSIPLTLWIIHIRKEIQDPHTSSLPNKISFFLASKKWKLLQAACLASFSAIVGAYVLSVWMPYYLMHFLQYSPKVAYTINTIMLLLLILFALLSAYLSRFLGFPLLVKTSVVGTLILSYPLFWLLQNSSLFILLVVLLTFNFLLGSIFGVIFEVLSTLFSQARATSISMTFTLPTAIFGGITPLVLTHMTQKLGPMFPAFYIMAFGLLALPVALSLKAPFKQGA